MGDAVVNAELFTSEDLSMVTFEEFQALYLDGVKLVPGVDYTAESGSTRITILNQTLKSRGAGTHTLTLQFRQASGALKWAVQYYTLAEGTEAAAGEGAFLQWVVFPGQRTQVLVLQIRLV